MADVPELSPPGGVYRGGGDFSGLSDLGLWTSIAGAGLASVGAYYSVKSQKYQLESQALSLEFQSSMSARNARAAEQDAQAIMEAAQIESANLSAEYGQIKSEQKATAGGRGIEGGPGSQAEVQASIEYAKQRDIYQVNSNAVRAANAARTGSVNAQNESDLARVSAANVRRTSNTVNPYLAAGTSMLTSASGISDQWLYRNRYRYRGGR